MPLRREAISGFIAGRPLRLTTLRHIVASTRSLLSQKTHPRARSVGLHRWLIHQLRAGRRYSKLAGHLYSQRNLERRIAVEVVHEQRRLLIPELARAVPIGPSTRARAFNVRQIEPADSLNLFASRRDRIFDHHVLRSRSLYVKPRYDQITGPKLARERLDLPPRLLAVFDHFQPQVLASQRQTR